MIIIRPNGFSNGIPQAAAVWGKNPLKFCNLFDCVRFIRALGQEYRIDVDRFVCRLWDVRNQGLGISRNNDIPFSYREEITKTIAALVEVQALTPEGGSDLQTKLLKVTL